LHVAEHTVLANQAKLSYVFNPGGVFYMSTDKRKQSLYFPETMLRDLQHEADRLDRSLSWVVQRCVRVGMLELKKLPSTDEPSHHAKA
jgi:uncharacterized small protein (TIGR04563 family)